jgi:hypothetical protein
MEGCGDEEQTEIEKQREKEKKKKLEKSYGKKCFVVLKHSHNHSLISQLQLMKRKDDCH